MKTYKVIFENNIPLYAQLVKTPSNIGVAEFKTEGDKTFIHCLSIKGFSENDALETANKVVKNIWDKAMD